jgi:hypothetical protein
MWLILCLWLSNSTPARSLPEASTHSTAITCPTVNISCPDTVDSGQPVTFMAAITGLAPDAKLSYKWGVSAGVITEGQGGASMKVETRGLSGVVVTATLEVEGLDSRCSSLNKASCATTVRTSCSLIPPFDQYGNLSAKDERARLDNIALTVKRETGRKHTLSLTRDGEHGLEKPGREPAAPKTI